MSGLTLNSFNMKNAFLYILIFLTGTSGSTFSQAFFATESGSKENNASKMRGISCKTATFLHPVEELIISGELKIVLVDDSVQMIRIVGDKAAIKSIRLKTDKVKSKLRLSTSMFALTIKKPLLILSLPHLKRLKIMDDALVRSHGTLHIEDLEIIMDAKAEVSLELAGNTVSTRLRGRGSIDINGAFQQMASKSGSGGWLINRYETAFHK